MRDNNHASVRQRRVSAELRALRQAKGLTCQQVADALDWSVSKVSRMETGIRGLYPDDVAAMLGYLEAPSKLRDELLVLVREGDKPNWLQIGRGLPSDLKNLIQIENEASALYNYEPYLVPGLLQTGDYATAVMRACNLQLAEGAADQMVRTRMGRQALLSRPNGPTLDAIIDEMVLRRPIGEPGVMHGQLQHLLNMANRARINIRVVPFAVGAHPGLEGPFMIMGFDAQPTLVWQEMRGAGGFLEEGRHVARAKLDWRELGSKALSPEESARFIAEIAGEMPIH
ncbi:helix-turn-helix domain-containing protein [Actinophytocola sp.]|uniref:helix-turn-helix domain-containing protein n=1 Tax=Actinophytocola sp. TaxID=1872138 RepID=UPI00389A67A6